MLPGTARRRRGGEWSRLDRGSRGVLAGCRMARLLTPSAQSLLLPVYSSSVSRALLKAACVVSAAWRFTLPREFAYACRLFYAQRAPRGVARYAPCA